MGEFEDKTVVVTGASRGIGLATVKAFVREGAFVVAVAHSAQNLDKGLAGVEPAPGTVLGMLCNLEDENDIRRLFADIAKVRPVVDVLVNNAGAYSEKQPWDAVPSEAWQGALALNTLAPYHCCVAAAHTMQTAGVKGCIVNVGSSTALRYKSGRTHYTVSKAALHAMNQVLALDLAAYGIRVNLVSPGPTATETVAARMNDPARRAAEDARMKKIPLGRYAAPEDIADAVVFLSSSKASFITGAVLPVDGGYTIGEPPG